MVSVSNVTEQVISHISQECHNSYVKYDTSSNWWQFGDHRNCMGYKNCFSLLKLGVANCYALGWPLVSICCYGFPDLLLYYHSKMIEKMWKTICRKLQRRCKIYAILTDLNLYHIRRNKFSYRSVNSYYSLFGLVCNDILTSTLCLLEIGEPSRFMYNGKGIRERGSRMQIVFCQ